MDEGLVIITTGVIVVIVILVIMALCIEVIAWTDGYLRKRYKEKKAKEAAVEDDSAVRGAEAAAIGLALYQYFTEMAKQEQQTFILEQRTRSPWSLRGRQDIMDQGRRFTMREK